MSPAAPLRWRRHLPVALLLVSVMAAGTSPSAAQGSGNSAEIRVGESSVPSVLAPGGTAAVRIRVLNNGATTWRAGTSHRLGAWYGDGSNQVTWGGFPCGGYMLNATDGRVFLCADVPPGGAYDFGFDVTVPSGAAGSVRLGVRMVQDGVEWFGQIYSWTIAVSSGGGCPCSSDPNVNNYCYYTPSTPGCGMTFPGGYCDPNGDGSYSDADWVRGYYDYQADCSAPPPPNLPDVTVADLTWTPANPQVGDPVQFHATVTNQGGAATPDIVGVGFSVGGFFGWGIRGPMQPGQTAVISLDDGPSGNRWVPSSSGAFTVTATADDINRFPESDENNNTRTAQVTVGGGPPPPTLPDVTITNLTWTPANPRAGDSVQFHATVKNVGNAPTPDIVGVGFSVGSFFGYGTTPAMVAGQTTTISLVAGPSGSRWIPPSSGTFTVTAVADDINRFQESNEANNSASAQVSVAGGGGGPAPNKFGIGLLNTGDALQYDRAASLVGPDGWVLAVCWGVNLQTSNTPQGCRDAVREIANRGQNAIVRISPPSDNRNIREDADPGSNHLRYDNLAQRYRQVVLDLLAEMGGSTKKLVVQIGNELNLCYEWVTTEQISWETMASEQAAFHRDVGDALASISDGRLVVVNAPLAPGGVTGCPSGTPGIISDTFITRMVQAVPGLFSSSRFDGFASHPYPSSSAGSGNPNVPFEQAALGLHDYEGELAATGNPSLPVYITETGWTSRYRTASGCADGNQWWEENQVADWQTRAFTSTDPSNRGWLWDDRIKAVTPFALGPDSCWDGFSFLNGDGSPRGRYNSLRNARCTYVTGSVCNPAGLNVAQSQTVSFPVSMPPNQALATFGTTWPGSDIVMELRTPSRRLINRETNAPDVVHDLGSTFESYRITNPEPGAWEVSLFGAEVAPEGENVLFTVATEPVDATAPIITPALSGTPGANGWYVSDVTVSFSMNDPESGIAYSSGCGTTTLTAETAGVTLTCTATNGVGLSQGASVTVKIDKTGPSAALVVTSGTLGSNGWYVSDVTVSTRGGDSISPPVTCTPPQFQTAETPGTAFHGSCTNDAGLVTEAAPLPVRLDKTPPLITGSRTPPPNAAGWNNTDVTVTFKCTDAVSGVAAPPLSPQVVSSEGAGQSRSATCTDFAGHNATASVDGINIDKTPPLVVVTRTPPPNANGWNNSDVRVGFAASDALSGVAGDALVELLFTLEGANQSATRVFMDRAGNSATAGTGIVNIDKTPPEAYNQFDPATRTVSVFGRDALSGVPSGPVAPAAVAPTSFSGEVESDDDEPPHGKRGERDEDDRARWELRTYRIVDRADNALTLVERVRGSGEGSSHHRDEDHGLRFEMVSLQYGQGPLLPLPRNRKRFEWALGRDGRLKELNQVMEVKEGHERQRVRARFEAEKGRTVLWIGWPKPGRRVVRPGLALLRMATDKGKLAIEY